MARFETNNTKLEADAHGGTRVVHWIHTNRVYPCISLKSINVKLTENYHHDMATACIAGFHCHAIKIKNENHPLNEVKKLARYRGYICYSPAGRSVLGKTVPEVLDIGRGRYSRQVPITTKLCVGALQCFHRQIHRSETTSLLQHWIVLLRYENDFLSLLQKPAVSF